VIGPASAPGLGCPAAGSLAWSSATGPRAPTAAGRAARHFWGARRRVKVTDVVPGLTVAVSPEVVRSAYFGLPDQGSNLEQSG